MRRRRVTPWRRDSTEMASGKPGAVQFDVKASELREDYIAEVLEIHTADGRILDGRFAACKKARGG